jgi:tetratricopeptide (TPR) repeat protein
MRILGLIGIAIVLLAGVDSAGAEDSLGTAGPFRVVGTGKCEAGFIAQFQGACDPPPVDQNLPPEQRSQAEVQRALKLISLIRMDQAKSALDAAIAADPRNVAAYKLRARLAIPGSTAAAEQDVNAGLLLAPNDSDLLAMRASLAVDCTCPGPARTESALRFADAAIAANPDNADALWIRAQIRVQAGRAADAESDLTHALAVDPGDTRAQLLRAQVRMALGRIDDAAGDASAVLAQNPADMSARQLRAVTRTELGDLAGAIDDLGAILGEPGKVANVTPSAAMFGDLYLQRAILLVAAGRTDEAMRDLDSIVAIGGQPAVLRMQVYLRRHGFPDVPIDGKRSDVFDDAIKACFVDKACGHGLTQRG